jgi:glutathione S-transferase
MLTLYYSPGACSMASHIGLEESGAPYEAKLTSTAKGEHQTPEYLAINPRGKVPALRVGTDVVTENVAILTYVARQYPAANLLPKDALQEARCISHMAWLSNTVHPSFTRVFRPERFVSDERAHPAVKESGREAFWGSLQELDGLLAGKDWVAGRQYTVCDPYTLVFYGWGRRIDLPVHELTSLTAWKERMLARTAVQTVLKREKSILLPQTQAA